MRKYSYYFLLLLWVPGALYAQQSIPSDPLLDPEKNNSQDKTTTEEDTAQLHFSKTLSKQDADRIKDPFSDNIFSLRGLDKEVARLEFSSKGSTLLGGVLPVGFSSKAKVRLRDEFTLQEENQIFDINNPTPNPALTGDYFSTSLEGEIKPIKQLSLIPSVGVERSSSVGAIQNLDSVDTGMAFVYHLGDRIKLRFRTGFTQSQLEQAPSQLGATGLNNSIALAPVQTRTTDIGGEYNGKHLFLGVNTFHRQISGVVETVRGLESQGFQLVTVGDGFTSGMETEQQQLSFGFLANSLQGVSLWSKQTLLISRVDDGSGAERSIQGVPLLIANAGLRYQNVKSGTNLSARATYLGTRTGLLNNSSSDLLLDVTLRQRIKKNISWFVNAENLTDQQQTASDLDLKSGIATQELESTGRTFFTGFVIEIK